MRTGLTKQEKTTDIWFDEKDPLIHIRTHNTDLKKRLAAYAGQHPDQCRQTKGTITFFPRKCWFLGSLGLIHIAVSPMMVSGRVVATRA